MRIAVLSDIHANMEAIQSTLERLASENIDLYVSLGDIVGYGADPNGCVEIVRDVCDVKVIGNHDYAALGRLDISYFNPYAKKSVIWTGEKLTEENRTFLESLPLIVYRDDMIFVHATPYKPEDWNYIFTVYDARVNFNFFKEKVCFIGHSHQPVFILMSGRGEIFVHTSPKLDIEEGFRYIINVGSVGQPRDSNPESSFVIYDTDAQTIELLRQPYDIKSTQSKMSESQIHPFLIERLAYGK